MRARETIRTLNRLIVNCRAAEDYCLACAKTRGGLQLRGLSVKALFLGSSEALVLEEWQHEQQRVLNRYKEALQGYLARRILRTVNTQFVRIEQRLDQIQSLRQGYAVGSPNISHV